MDNSKKAQFVRKMGKKRLSLVNGGVVRKKYDIGGLLGTAGGAGGTGFHINSGTDQGQLTQAYDQNQAALAQQQGLANTLTPQAASGVNAQNVLSNQYAQQAEGAGPNVAANTLNQATSQNVANQAALMAGQRGAGSNPALVARQAAMQGAQTQQQSAGQAATMQAQQQIAAQQAQAQLAANQISQAQGAQTAATQAAQGEQGILQNANTANNNVMGQLANTQMQGQQSLMGGLMKGVGAISGLFAEGGEVSESNPSHPMHGHKKLEFIHKMAKMGMDHFDSGGAISVPNVTVNAAPSQPFAPVQSVAGGFTPTAATDPFKDITNKKKGESGPAPLGQSSDPLNPNIYGGNVTSDLVDSVGPATAGDSMAMALPMVAEGGQIEDPYQQKVNSYFMAEGGVAGKVAALVSPGEIYLKPDQVQKVISQGADPLKIGYKIPGKASVKGNSEQNDVVPADLDEGGVVIKRTETMSRDKAAKFVHKAIAKKKARGN